MLSQDDFVRYIHERAPYLLRSMGVPDNLINPKISEIDSSLWDGAIASIKAGRGLYLRGLAGRGKSNMAVAVLRECMLSKIFNLGFDDTDYENTTNRMIAAYRFEGTNEILQAIRMSYSDSGISDNESAILNRLYNCRVLVLDDFGVSKSTEWVMQTFDAIIDFRHQNARTKITIVTSNLSLDQIDEKYGDRIASRIAEMCDSFEITGPDRRILGHK